MNTKILRWIFSTALAVFAVGHLAGCEMTCRSDDTTEDTLEEVGEGIEDVGEDVGEGVEDATDVD